MSEERQGRFGSAKSVPQICGALKKAAYDPRVSGVYIKARACSSWGVVWKLVSAPQAPMCWSTSSPRAVQQQS